MILLSVMTAPRPPEAPDYLSATLKALDDSGANLCDEKRVCVDGGVFPDGQGHQVSKGWIFHPNKQRTGHMLALWRVFMLAKERDADFLISCEDDIAVAPGAIEKIVRTAHQMGARFVGAYKPLAFITFYDRRLREGTAPGLYPEPCMDMDGQRWFYGSQCFLMPRTSIEYLLTCNPLDCRSFPNTFNSGDCAMGHFFAQSPWPYFGIHVPCLVDHVGDFSAVGTQRFPIRGHNFAGERDEVWKEMQRPFYGGEK